jgi:hypothetical protein
MQDITGYEGLYAVTESGHIWSYPKRVQVGNNGGFRNDEGRWIKATHVNIKTKHLRVYLAKNGIKKPLLVHRLVGFAFIPNPENYPHINHKDGNPENNMVANLEWCTPQHNSQHAYKTGLNTPPMGKSGEENANAKLTNELVLAIREAYRINPNVAEVARQFNRKPRYTWDICNRKRWQHI